MGSRAERTYSKAAAGRLGEVVAEGLEQERRQLADWGVPHLCADKLGGTTGEQDKDRPRNPGFQYREIKPQTSD